MSIEYLNKIVDDIVGKQEKIIEVDQVDIRFHYKLESGRDETLIFQFPNIKSVGFSFEPLNDTKINIVQLAVEYEDEYNDGTILQD